MSSCIDEIDPRSGNEESTLVLESFLVPGEPANFAHLSTSVVVNTSNQEFLFPEDATIILEEISSGDQAILEYQAGLGYYAEESLIVEEGKTYEISASVPDENFDIVFGRTTIPSPVEILDVELLNEDTALEMTDGNMGRRYDFLITLEPSNGAPKYFHLFPSAEIDSLDGEGNPVIISKGLEPFENFNFSLGGGNAFHDLEHLGGILINQSKLQNDQLLVSFYTNPDFNFNDHIISDIDIQLRTVELDYYNFLISTSKQIKAQETNGGQPVASFSNVTNGLGVVSSYAPSSTIIEVQ